MYSIQSLAVLSFLVTFTNGFTLYSKSIVHLYFKFYFNKNCDRIQIFNSVHLCDSMMDLFFPTETFSKWTIIVTIVSWVIFYFFMRFTYWIRHGRVAYVPVKFPYIFGNISGEKHLALQLADVYENYKSEPIVAINILLEPVLVLTDLNLIKSVLTDSFDNFQDRGVFYNDKVDPLSAILGSLNYAKWKPLRGKLAQAFTSAKIKKMLENTIETFVNELENGLNDHLAFSNYIEIRDLFSRFATDVILTSTIGIQCNTLKTKSKLREIVKKAMQPNMKYPWNIVTLVYPRLARLIGIRKHSKEVGDFFMDIVEQTIQYRHGCRETRNDYMQLLIDLGLAKNQIAALAFDLWSAGYADSTSTIAYCLYELSLRKNKHIQDKVRDEIRTVLEQNNGHLTYAVLQMMGYLKNVINGKFGKISVE